MSDADKLAQEVQKVVSQLQRHSIEERRYQIDELVHGLASEGLSPSDDEQAAYLDYIDGRILFEELIARIKSVPKVPLKGS